MTFSNRVDEAALECSSCNRTFWVPFPARGTVQLSDWIEELSFAHSHVEEIDGEPVASCEHCGEEHEREAYITAILEAKSREATRQSSCLIFKCECCGERIETKQKERCRVCEEYGPQGREKLEERGQRCEVCEQRFLDTDLVEHHTSYIPEETITVCTSCHGRIHNTRKDLSELEPELSRDEWKQNA